MTEPSTITAHAHDPDHVAQALASLASQFRRPALEALATTWASQAQDLEDALWELYGLGIDDITISGVLALVMAGLVLLIPQRAGGRTAYADAP